MNLKKLLENVQRLVDAGHGDAVVVFIDTRSGVSEEIESYDTISENFELTSGEILEEVYPMYEA